MVYFMGDIHGRIEKPRSFVERHNVTENDVIIILGDVGANYYGDRRDRKLKTDLCKLGPIFFCIHGNHEKRPSTIAGYQTKAWNGGLVWYEEEYPNLLFAKDGDVYTIDGIRYLVLGGAYSVDKQYRLDHGYGWWPDEQPSDEIKAYVDKRLNRHAQDVVLSHTCPFRYEPVEAFLPMIDQSTVDNSTEKWLDTIESSIDYEAWYCGHWHIDKQIDRIHFLFSSVESDAWLQEKRNRT